MIKTIYGRVFSVLVKKPFRLWGITLLGLFLTSLGSVLSGAVPLIAVAIALLMGLGINRVYLRGYRGEDIRVENLFDGFRQDFGKKLAGSAWAELFKLLWGLIPIVGFIFAIIRSYEYAFVPYILMERPEVAPLEARKVSREETKGWKGFMFGADILTAVLVAVAFLILIGLSAIPVIGILFRLVTFIYILCCIAFLPLLYGLLHAAFYEEITTGRMAAERQAQETPKYNVGSGAGSASPMVYCPSCGSPVKADSRFCPNCGSALAQQIPQPTEEAPQEPKDPTEE